MSGTKDRFRTSRCVFVVFAVGLSGLSLADEAHAQSSIEDDPLYVYSFTLQPTHIELLETLDLIGATDDQRAVVLGLYESFMLDVREQSGAYLAEMRAGWSKRQQHNDGRRRFEDPNARPRGSSSYDPTDQLRWREAKPRLERSFAGDVPFVLEEDQHDAWNAAMRRTRRESRFAPAVARFGVGVEVGVCDLVAVADEIELTPESRAAIEPYLLEYEIELDLNFERTDSKAIQLRMERSRLTRNDPVRENPETVEAVSRQFEFWQEQRLGLIRLCDRTRNTIRDALPEPARSQFIIESGKRMWPEIYAESPTQLAIRMIRDRDLVDIDRLAALESLESRYQQGRMSIIKRMEQRSRGYALTLDPEQRDALIAEMQRFQLESSENRDEFRLFEIPGVEDARERLLLEVETVRQIRRLFDPNEIEHLPAALQLALDVEIEHH